MKKCNLNWSTILISSQAVNVQFVRFQTELWQWKRGKRASQCNVYPHKEPWKARRTQQFRIVFSWSRTQSFHVCAFEKQLWYSELSLDCQCQTETEKCYIALSFHSWMYPLYVSLVWSEQIWQRNELVNKTTNYFMHCLTLFQNGVQLVQFNNLVCKRLLSRYSNAD